MEAYKEEFIHFMIDCSVLRFGDFVTKSGRKTPFFVNTGFYRTGAQLAKLGEYYAEAIHAQFGDTPFDILFGPAYKGIPLSVATSIALSRLYGKEVGYCADRKEAKDHGEKGNLLGAPIEDGSRVLIIEDVTTAGTSIRETHPLITSQAKDVQVIGLVVSVDRQERGTGEASALQELSTEFSMPTTAIVTMTDVVECLFNRPYKEKVYIDEERKHQIDAYYAEYGAK
ncbi:MAG: orotate phosphoribosyltransferase [Lachnospiraceae bacterium]|nr:orotate phosphoribosyltransferase [Lachnospiraceae bacterium]